MIKALKEKGVLGMNCRNAEYIMRHNPRAAFPRVDDKVLTKKLAAEYQIPTPRLHHVFHHHGAIRDLGSVLGELREFVVKPARGTGGSGILLVMDRTSEGFTKSSGETISREDLAYHIQANEIRAEMKERISILGQIEGYLLAPAHILHQDVATVTVKAVIWAALEFGTY